MTSVRDTMNRLVTRSAAETEARAGAGVEAAMMGLNDSLMRERAARYALLVGETVSDAMDILKSTAQMPELADGSQAVQKEILDALVRRFPMFLTVARLDHTGQETAKSSVDHVVTPGDLHSRPSSPYFFVALDGKQYIGRDRTGDFQTDPVLRVAVPIAPYKNAKSGVLAARLSLADLWDSIAAARIGKGGFAYVEDDQGRPLLHPRPADSRPLTASVDVTLFQETYRSRPWRVAVSMPRAEAMAPVLALQQDIDRNSRKVIKQMRASLGSSSRDAAAALQKASATIRESASQAVLQASTRAFRQINRVAIHQSRVDLAGVRSRLESESRSTVALNEKDMGRLSLSALARLASSSRPLANQALSRSSRRLAAIALTITLICGLLGGALAIFTAGMIVRPVLRLRHAALAIADGDLDKRVHEHAPDEIGDLALAFNSMAESLQKSRSELVDAESQLVQSAKLASLGTLSAGVAHELNQPVAVIRGLAQQQKQAPGLPDDLKADLQLIEDQTGRMIKIIRHLRTFCRADAGESEEMDLNKIVQDCTILIGEQLRAHNIEIRLELADELSPVSGHSNEIEQVLLNLIGNARDALEGRQDARITVQTAQ
ncbi:MAG TPA: HAMP domain-containing protein, partial [Chthonomonadales bacterium]|nr:HAMP domain-containing protein [Chthonomonadales bacterium]